MSGIFICYRRSDARAYAGRLHHDLADLLGPELIRRDVDSIEPGSDFTDSIWRAVESSDVVLVIIGREWLTARDAQGRRQIDDLHDPVRLEIEAALHRGTPVVPVLVEEAEMPAPDELPPSLRELASRQPARLTDANWRGDVQRLVTVLPYRRVPSPKAAAPPAQSPSDRDEPPLPRAPSPAPRSRPSPPPSPSPSSPPSAPARRSWPGWFRRRRRRRPAEGAGDVHRSGAPARVPIVPDPSPDQAGELVECSVFAPPEVRSGAQALVQVHVHLLEQALETLARAQEFDAEATRRAVRTLANPIPRGTVLHFDLQMAPLHVEEPVDSLVWRGRPEAAQFHVTVPGDCPHGAVIGRVGVSQGTVPIGHIRFRVTVVDSKRAPAPAAGPVGDDAVRYRSAFVSYASGDRAEVVKRLQLLRAVGIAFFQDIDMEPGERWAQRLYLQIDDSDLFLLFWSSAARSSEWVRKEAGYALQRRGVDHAGRPDIRPVLIEGPPVPPPWEELSHLHFGDRLLYVLAGSTSP